MLQQLSPRSRRATWLTGAIMAMALVPGQLVARTVPAAAAPVLRSGLDRDLPRLAPERPAMTPQDAPAGRPAAAKPAVPSQDDSPTAVDVLQQRLAEMQKLLQDAEAKRAGTQTLDDLKRLELAREYQSLEHFRMAEQLAQAEAAVRAQQSAVDAGGSGQDMVREAERQLELAKREQVSQQRELERLLADQPQLRQRLLQQRLEELSHRLEMLNEMQRQLKMESEQLKRELNAF